MWCILPSIHPGSAVGELNRVLQTFHLVVIILGTTQTSLDAKGMNLLPSSVRYKLDSLSLNLPTHKVLDCLQSFINSLTSGLPDI